MAIKTIIQLPLRIFVGGVYCFLIQSHVRIYNYQRKWHLLLSTGFWVDYTVLQPQYENLMKPLSNNLAFLSDYAGLAYQNGDYLTAVRVLNKSKLLFAGYMTYMYSACCYQQLKKPAEAFDDFRLSCCMVPNRFLPRYKMFVFLIEQHRLQEAALLREEISKMPVKVPGKVVDFVKEKVNGEPLFQTPLSKN